MCEGIARCILIVFNIIFLIFGIICLGVGIWVKVDDSYMIHLFRVTNVDTKNYDVPSLLESGAVILIAVGALIFVIAFFGFCGAAKKSKCCLIIYGVLVGIVLVVQLAAGILAAVYKEQFDSTANDALADQLPKLYDGPYKKDNAISLALDVMQASQKCCGLNGPNDFSSDNSTWKGWNKTFNHVPNAAIIPFTCCDSKNQGSYPEDIDKYITGLVNTACPTTGTGKHTQGCYDKIKDLIQTYYVAILGSAVAVALLEFILIVVACCIAFRNKDDFVA